MKRERNSFSWLLRTVVFFIVMQLKTTARAGYTGFATAAASAKFPGEIDPQHLSILVGSNANITCRLSNPNSSNIWFFEQKTKRRIKQPTDEIQIIDPYTAALIIHDAVEQISWYQCKIGDQAIGETELNVGTKPQNVTDFACIVYDYEYMQCNFTRPKNMLLISFQLKYRIDEDKSIYECKVTHSLSCNLPKYLPVRDKYLFTLTGLNAGGQNVQNFTIYNHKIVIPSALNITVHSITSDSISLTWEQFKIISYPKGLLYEFEVSDDNRTNWHKPQTEDLQCQNGNCKIVIKNLYAFWHYWIKVRVKSNATDMNNDNFWSDATTKQFRTIGKLPKRAPETPLGSFYIDSSETQLRLYWEQLPQTEHNGPGFHYVVNEINRHNVVMLSTKTNETTTTFAWKNESMQIFTINSANSYGESINSNVIRVFRSASPRNELNENFISKVYHNTSYTLSWYPPENLDELMNYTVFWCLPKIELPNQCKGPISYKYLDKFSTNFTTEPKDRSLNLALSANYPNYNKGMQWARCSADISSELMKMELEVTALNESAILVKWSSGIVCASILKGYNLTYCQESKGHCSPVHTVELLRDKQNYRNYTITDIPPFTNVCIRMMMYSSTKNGRNSEENCVRTKESAPSPPKNVKYLQNTVTSKSAVVEWKPPDLKNGILSHYTVYWRKYPDNTFEKNTTSIENTSYTLTGLSSYSNYEVYVTAHTVKESVPSKLINITTLIGIPSSPRNLNIYENDTVIYWDQPYLPSGRHLFYVVALLRRDNQYNSFVYERVSTVKGRSCRFQLPDCLNKNKASYVLQVRAVNVGERHESDTEIKSMNEDEILARTPIDKHFCQSDEAEESFFTKTSNKSYFASSWIDAPRSYSCSTSSKASIYAVALIVIIAFAGYLCYWIRNKYYKMKNIKVILPEGLVDHVSNYKFASNSLDNGSELGSSSKKEFHSDISRSNDCLVPFGHKANFNLMSNFHNGSSNALSSLSSNSMSKAQLNEDQTGGHPSLETTNEELSSNSSSVSNSNFKYHDHHRHQRLSSIDSNNTVPISGCEQDEEDDQSEPNNLPNSNATQNAGYVTHNSQLLASILNATDKIAPSVTQFNTTFPAMTNDGYIQPSAAKQLFQPSLSHHPSPSTINFNGYTSIEDVGKSTILPNENNISTSVVNSSETNLTSNAHPYMGINLTSRNLPLDAVSSIHHQTSPVITDLHETITDLDFNKPAIALPNAINQPIPITHTSLQPNNSNNNSNNTIFGYVTQQQLANFGTNVALGKELNS